MSAPSGGRLLVLRALRSRPFALLWAGQTISALGDGAFYTALAWTVLLLTHSGTAMGIVAIAPVGPVVLFLLVGGVAADRLPRRLVLLWSDGGRGLVVLAIAALGRLGLLQFWHLVILALLFGIADGFFMPAYQAIPPQLVAVEALPFANALTGLSRQLGQMAGPALDRVLARRQGRPPYDWRGWVRRVLAEMPPGMPRLIGIAGELRTPDALDMESEHFVAHTAELLPCTRSAVQASFTTADRRAALLAELAEWEARLP